MTAAQNIRILQRAIIEFRLLSRKSKYKATLYKVVDIICKIVLSLCGALITYFTENDKTSYMLAIRIMGITISSLTAISSVFMFEKRSLSNIQIHSKCETIIPEIEEKIDALQNNENTQENIHEYIRKLFKELSILSLSSFTDAIFEKIASRRISE